MILETEKEIQREFNVVYNHLVELKYALDQKQDSRSNRIFGLIKKMDDLIREIESRFEVSGITPLTTTEGV